MMFVADRSFLPPTASNLATLTRRALGVWFPRIPSACRLPYIQLFLPFSLLSGINGTPALVARATPIELFHSLIKAVLSLWSRQRAAIESKDKSRVLSSRPPQAGTRSLRGDLDPAATPRRCFPPHHSLARAPLSAPRGRTCQTREFERVPRRGFERRHLDPPSTFTHSLERPRDAV